MANPVRITQLIPPFLDRLLDDDSHIPTDTGQGTWTTLSKFKSFVARDLETLLNTRCAAPTDEDLEAFPLAKESFLTYGIMDLSGMSMKNPDDQAHVRDNIRAAIERHEPRLSHVSVSLEPSKGTIRVLHFRVDAKLAFPGRPAVAFDALLELSSSTYKVNH